MSNQNDNNSQYASTIVSSVQDINDGNSKRTKTEKDIFFEVSINLTKIQIQKYQQKSKELRQELNKQIFNQNLQLTQQVWAAFSKFIKNQCKLKQKYVNTQIAGIFSPISQNHEFSVVQFYPSPDFMNASRLKLKKSSFSDEEGYDKFYENLLSQTQKDQININFGSIAMVCTKNTSTEQAYQIIKEIFASIINNPKDRSLRINFKNFGYLLINQGGLGYIQFIENPNESDQIEQNNYVENKNSQQAKTEDLASFVDNISYKLSVGDGQTMSIKSGFLSNLSIKTPRSNFSNILSQNSVIKDPNYWCSFTKKQRKIAVNDDSIFETKSPYNNHSTINQDENRSENERKSNKSTVPSHCDQPNLILRQRHSLSLNESNNSLSNKKKQSIPYPFLHNLLENMGVKPFSKRVRFNLLPKEKILAHIQDQIKENTQKKKEEFEKKIQSEKQEIKSIKNSLYEDNLNYLNDKLFKKLDYMTSNDLLMQHKLDKQQKEISQKFKEKTNFFPFIYGEDVLQKRKENNEKFKEYYDKKFEEQQKQKEEDKQKQEDNIRQMKIKKQEKLNKDQEEIEFQEFLNEQRIAKILDQNPQIPQNIFENSKYLTSPHLPDLPQLSDPFVRGRKLPYPVSKRFRHQSHLINTMEQAVQRSIQNIKEMENMKNKELDSFHQKVQQGKEKTLQEKQKIENQKLQTREDLLKQQEEKKKKKEELIRELKQPMQNTFGPIDNQDVIEMQINLRKQKKEKNKQDLQEQILKIQEDRNQKLKSEFDNDRKMVLDILSEEVEHKEKDKMYKLFTHERNQKVWGFQKDQKQKIDFLESQLT